MPKKLYKLESTSKCKTPFVIEPTIVCRKDTPGVVGGIFKTLVSNFVGCDVEPSVTLTMVTVMLGSEVVKVFVRHS